MLASVGRSGAGHGPWSYSVGRGDPSTLLASPPLPPARTSEQRNHVRRDVQLKVDLYGTRAPCAEEVYGARHGNIPILRS